MIHGSKFVEPQMLNRLLKSSWTVYDVMLNVENTTFKKNVQHV